MRKEIPPKKRKEEESLEYEKVCALCKEVGEFFCGKVTEAHFLNGRKKLHISASLSHPPNTQIDQKSSAAMSRKQGKST